MDPWPFVTAAYGLVGLSTFGLLVWTFGRLRRAERRLKR